MIRCLSCAHDNADAQKFCGECGARLPGAVVVDEPVDRPRSYTPRHLAKEVLSSRFALEGERKLVTVMFCDIANSTPLAARIGAEAMHGLLNQFFELALSEVHRYEGTINQFLGDGFMALFGAPIAFEDHARRALLAATAIQQHVRDATNDALALRELGLRIGLNTGMVVVGSIGDNLRLDYTAFGDATNLAARLQGFADPGTIRVSESTRRASQAHFEFKNLGRHALKGIAVPVAVFEPQRPRITIKTGSGNKRDNVGSALVGREHELAALSQSLSNLRSGQGGVVLIRGEPGVGKSRLLAEAKQLPQAQVMRWLEGRCVSFGRGLSYLPFIEIVKGVFGIGENDSETQALRKIEVGARDLFDARASEIVPYLATLMALVLTSDHEQRIKFLDAQAMKRQVFLSMRQLFERLAAHGPLLVCLEDWHWVDQSSIALCEHLLPLAEGLPIAFWLACRAEPAEPAARIRPAAANTNIRLDEIALAPLAGAQSRALLDNLVGAGTLSDGVRSHIERRTGGNPFFVEEVVRALIADGTLVPDSRSQAWRLARPIADLVISDTVQGVVLARVDRLEEGVKSVLKLAAVIGHSFLLRILKTIAEARDNVEQGLGRLEDAELIRLRQRQPELEYIFKNILVQEAAYGSILAERRRVIHRSVARAIEALFADRIDEMTSLLAHHYALAEDWEMALTYLTKAGDQAGRIAADVEALEHYRQADAIFMRIGARELTPLQRAAMDRKLGQAFYGVGDYEQAVAYSTRALSLLGVRYPKTRWGVRGSALKYLAAHFLRRLMPAHRDFPFARRMDLATAQEISATCRSLAWLDYFADEERFVLDGLIELDAGERSGDVIARVRGLGLLAVVLSMFGALAPAHRRANEAIAIAQADNDAALISHAALARGWIEFARAPVDKCKGSLEQSASAFRSIGDIRGWAGPTAYLYWVHYWLADLAEVAKTAAAMVEIGAGAGDPHVVCWGRNGLGLASTAMGPLEEAVEHFLKARELSIQITSYRFQAGIEGQLGKCRIRQGRLSEAATFLEESVRLIEGKNLRGMWSSDTLNGLVALWLARAVRLQGAERRAALNEARRWCRRALRCTRHAVGWLAETQRLQGTLTWLCQEPTRANAYWNWSLDTANRGGMPLEAARTLLEMGVWRSDAGLVEQARQVFEQTDADVDLAFCTHALARMSAAAGSDAEPALRRYDQAITSLDAVNAEYNLGLACQERAQLLTKLGAHDRAQADLARARQCFATVGATDGKFEG